MAAWEVRESLLCSEEKLPPPLVTRKRGPPALERVTENGNGDSEQSEVENEAEESSSESSDSGSSNSSSSSSGSSSTTGSEAQTNMATGLFQTDEYGEFLPVNCNSNDAKLYLTRFARGSIGRCVLFRGRWITPNEFQAVCGRQSSKDWKRSIRLRGRCLKEYIAQGLFQEHPKSCTCKICSGEDKEFLRQEGEMALAAKRRRLSQADSMGSGSQPNETVNQTGGSTGNTEKVPEATPQQNPPPAPNTPTSGNPPKKRKRGRPPKVKRVWSPSGEVAPPEASSNDDDFNKASQPVEMEEGSQSNPSSVIDSSDFIPRRSRRSAHKKHFGHRTELGTFTRKPSDWDTEEVGEFLRLQGFADFAEAFQEGEIDGQALFLLKESHLLEKFSMKLGPTLRLLDTISRLRHPPLQ